MSYRKQPLGIVISGLLTINPQCIIILRREKNSLQIKQACLFDFAGSRFYPKQVQSDFEAVQYQTMKPPFVCLACSRNGLFARIYQLFQINLSFQVDSLQISHRLCKTLNTFFTGSLEQLFTLQLNLDLTTD
jgi:hypothetical protein